VKSLIDVRKTLLQRWNKGDFLRDRIIGREVFPLELPLSPPSSAELSQKFEIVRSWIEKLEAESLEAHFSLEWKERNHRLLGRSSVPRSLVIPDYAKLIRFLGVERKSSIILENAALLLSRFPPLEAWILKNPFTLWEQKEQLPRLIALTLWKLDNPKPEIYLRQVSLPGVDTKFIEGHKKILNQWWSLILPKEALCPDFTGVSRFEERYFFKKPPALVRFRILDNTLAINGLTDLTLRADEIKNLSLDVKRVFVVENMVTALSFPSIPKAIVIFGAGYHFDHFYPIQWLRDTELLYWGDLDTHGFAILNQFRRVFPHTKSFLMDQNTLLEHRISWGYEPKQAIADLDNLTSEESTLYKHLKDNHFAANLRLEQEYINYQYVEDSLTTMKQTKA